jgi:hypothetical protein
MEDVTQPSIENIPYEELVKIATEKADAIVKKEFEKPTFYLDIDSSVRYTGLAQERFDSLYEEFYKELCELKQAKVEKSYSEEYLKQELFRTVVTIETLQEVEKQLSNDIITEILEKETKKLSHFIHLAASKFAKEYTKWTHKFPFDESGNLTKEAQKTYDILFTSKKNKLVKELPESVQVLIKPN